MLTLGHQDHAPSIRSAGEESFALSDRRHGADTAQDSLAGRYCLARDRVVQVCNAKLDVQPPDIWYVRAYHTYMIEVVRSETFSRWLGRLRLGSALGSIE